MVTSIHSTTEVTMIVFVPTHPYVAETEGDTPFISAKAVKPEFKSL